MLACDLGMVGHSREDEGVFHYFIISFFFFFSFKNSLRNICVTNISDPLKIVSQLILKYYFKECNFKRFLSFLRSSYCL